MSMDPYIRFNAYQKHILPKTKQQQEEEEKVYAEYANLVANLPITKCGLTFHHYQGFWFLDKNIKDVISAQDHFQSQSSDILLASCPKSGTTWLKALIFAIVHRKLHPSLTTTQHPLHEHNPHDLVLSIEHLLHGNGRNCEFDADFPQPRLLGTHMPYTSLPQSVLSSGCKIIYVSRNPKDNLVSAWHYIRNWVPELKLEEVFEGYMKGHSLYGPYWDHVLGYWREAAKKPEKILFLKYEQLLEEPSMLVKSLGLFMGCPFSEDEERTGVVQDIVSLCRFKNMSNYEVNKTGVTYYGKSYSTFFRKGGVGDSRNYLTEQMIKLLDEITEQKFKGSGLIF